MTYDRLPKPKWYGGAFRGVLRALVYVLVRPKVIWNDKNLKNELKNTPAVFVCNHTHHFDGVVVGAVLSRFKPYTLVKKSWYDKSGVGTLIRLCRSIPVDFETGDAGWYACSREAVQNGYSLLIFPEGGIAREGRMLDFKPGAALLAAKDNLMLVPVASYGKYKLIFGKCQKIIIGEPIVCRCPENVRYSVYAKQVSAESKRRVAELYFSLEEKYGKETVYYAEHREDSRE